jgi:hypothetical protein
MANKKMQYVHTGKQIHFDMCELDSDGKPLMIFDNDGNKKGIKLKDHPFKMIPYIDPMTGKQNANTYRCVYTLEADDPRYDEKLKKLEELRKLPYNNVCLKKDYDKIYNPQAAKLDDQLEKKDAELNDAKRRIQELQDRLSKGK